MLSKGQIEDLRLHVESDQNDYVAHWVDSGGEYHRIMGVSDGPIDIDRDGVPVPIAFLRRGHIDLENVEPASIVAISSFFD